MRYEGAGPSAPVPVGVTLVDVRSVPFDRIADYDRRFFPARREAFLACWIGLPERMGLVALRDGVLVGMAGIRNGETGARIGPLYAASPDIAAALVSELSRRWSATGVAIDVPDRNSEAGKLFQSLGLRPAFETARMYTGGMPEIEMSELYGVASLELG